MFFNFLFLQMHANAAIISLALKVLEQQIATSAVPNLEECPCQVNICLLFLFWLEPDLLVPENLNAPPPLPNLNAIPALERFELYLFAV